MIGQSGGPTCVINESLAGAAQEAAGGGVITQFLGARHGVAGIMAGDFVDLDAVSKERWEKIARTPCAALGSVRLKPGEEECARIFESFRSNDVRYFFYVGGNDTAETASILLGLARREGYDLKVFHIPKTIDNDLRVTDHCPGYGSAARFVAQAFMGDDLDNRSLPGVKVDVVMGRHAGWLTAASALARHDDEAGPHLICLPERVLDLDAFCSDVEAVYRERGRCLVAVSEGVHDADGNPVAASGEVDAHGNVQLSGTGALADFLVGRLKEHFRAAGVDGLRARGDTFGYLQRSFVGVRSETDAEEARRVGATAVRLATTTDATDGTVAIRRTGEGDAYDSEDFLAALSDVAKVTKDMPADFIDGDSDVTAEFLEYVRPLAGPLPAVARL